MPVTPSIVDKRMLKLIDLLKANGTIRFTQQFLDSIGMLKQNLRQVKEGQIRFNTDHILKACKTYKVNANWIFGLEKEVFRK